MEVDQGDSSPSFSVKVLRAGYCTKPQNGKYRAACTISLVRGAGITMLVETGSAWDGGLLVHALNTEGVQPHDVDYVVCTHGHSDHVGNLNLFPQSVHIVGYDIHAAPASKDPDARAASPLPPHDFMLMHDFVEGIPYDVVENYLQVIATPGHTLNSVSVLVKNVPEMGTVAIVGDLFESEEDCKNDEDWRCFSESHELQEAQRRRLLNKADYIVPGHGPMFKVMPAYKSQPSIEALD